MTLSLERPDFSTHLTTEESGPLYFAETEHVFDALGSVDWAFEHESTRAERHDLHPYPAKFIPQIPHHLIKLLTSPGDRVLDPFGGSGTTAVEAVRLGRPAISMDANPLAAMIGHAKIAAPSLQTLASMRTLHSALSTFLLAPPADPTQLVDQYGDSAPAIPNREKWFADSAFGELAHIRYRIDAQPDEARSLSLLALSRTVLSASFQDSETRYKSSPREIGVGETTRRFLRELDFILRRVREEPAGADEASAEFLTGDSRMLLGTLPDRSIDAIVTSPPYGNATDYHLYHRFRLLWLGFDPVALGHVEIGSHLKHQREASGFDSYLDDMRPILEHTARLLRPGRFACFVVGDSVYSGEVFRSDLALAELARDFGMTEHRILKRTLHRTKRSFTPAGRRAAEESLLVLRAPRVPLTVTLTPPPYRMHHYEKTLRARELASVFIDQPSGSSDTGGVDMRGLRRTRSLTFTAGIDFGDHVEPTWQATLEGTAEGSTSTRKDPKYVTHGIHPYKGKFYPQLAKALLNESRVEAGATVLDPFCGSGTTLLESHLNGFRAYGCDLNPLAASIARAKVGLIGVDPSMVREAFAVVDDALANGARSPAESPFSPAARDELERWFAPAILSKLETLISVVRESTEGVVREYLEVVVSSLLREVSHQEPGDLRIRYRVDRLEDADVVGLFRSRLRHQFERVEAFWRVRAQAPREFLPAVVMEGDNRTPDVYRSLGLQPGSVDAVLTSPPYAMALPYIDTDRLSLLALRNMTARERRPVEDALTGSRELTTTSRRGFEQSILEGSTLPSGVREFLVALLAQVTASTESGFRRKNMPALMYRFLFDMDAVLTQLASLCRPGADVSMVIGDSRMMIDGEWVRLPTTDLVEQLAIGRGFAPRERIDISVTSDGMLHHKNAIKENVVLRMTKV